jgi:hypothetical protein
MRTLALLALILIGCGGFPAPKRVAAKTYELAYCEVEQVCLDAAKATCPSGFSVVRWENKRTHTVVCL